MTRTSDLEYDTTEDSHASGPEIGAECENTHTLVNMAKELHEKGLLSNKSKKQNKKRKRRKTISPKYEPAHQRTSAKKPTA